MKKVISFILAGILAGTLSLTAFAQSGSNDNKLDSRITKLEDRQQKLDTKAAEFKTKQEEYAAFREALMEHRQKVMDSRQANLELSAQTNQLRLDLAKKLKAIQDSGTQLPEETAQKLKDNNAQIKTLTEKLKETKGQIKAVKEEYKGYIRDKDYEAMDACFEKIDGIQSSRHDLLGQINTILQDMNKLVTDSADTAPASPNQSA